jgi:uncharacterized protein YdaU (DUF1376 family)
MTKPTDTWMPLYVGDYLRDTTRLTRDQHGAYLLIIMDYWVNGPPPDDDGVLAAITKATTAEWRKLRHAIIGFFTIVDGQWRHKRIDAERDISHNKAKARSEGGAKGAAKRWQGNGPAISQANSSPISSPISSANAEPPPEPLTNQCADDGYVRGTRPSPSQSSSLRSEDYSEPLRASGSARAPPMPADGAKSLWDKGLSILGPKQRSLLGKLRKSHGDTAVLAAIVDCEAENPSDPPAFLIACCQRRHDNDRKLSPVENLYLGAARAADAFDRRQREAARCPDCDAVEPLLDRRRSAC